MLLNVSTQVCKQNTNDKLAGNTSEDNEDYSEVLKNLS
jgi:hypothetical protein